MDPPAGVRGVEVQRVVGGFLTGVPARGRHPGAELHVAVVVAVEGDAPRERRVGLLVHHLVLEGVVDRVGPQRRVAARLAVHHEEPALGAFLEGAVDLRAVVDQPLRRFMGGVEGAAHGEVVVDGVEVAGDRSVLVGAGAPRPGAFLNLLRQQRHDVPVGQGLADGVDRRGEHVDEAVVTHRAQVPCLVMAGRGQQVVGPHGGRVHAHVDVDEQLLDLVQDTLAVLVGALVAAELVVGDRDQALDRAVVGHALLVDALVDHLHHFIDVEADARLELVGIEVPARFMHHLAAHELAEAAGLEAGELGELGERERQQLGMRPLDPGRIEAAMRPAVASQRQHQHLPPARVDAVGVAADVEAGHEHGLLRPGDVARFGAHHVGMDPGDLLRRFGGVLHRLGAHVHEGRLHRDAFDAEAAFERRIDRTERDRFGLAAHRARRFHRPVAHRIPHVEHVGLAVGDEIRLAQQLAVVVAHQQHQVGLLLDERGVVQLLGKDDLGQRHVEEGVRARLDGDPQVGVDRARVVVRRDGDDARAVVAGLPDVVGVGDAGRVGVEQRQHDVVGIEPGVGGEALDRIAVGEVGAGVEVPDVGEDVELDAAEKRGQAVGRGEPDMAQVAAAGMGHQGAGAVLLEDVDDLVGDLGRRLIPRDALPLALAALAGALHRVAQAVALVHRRRVDRALLAAAGVGVGGVRVDLRILGELLLAQHDAVLHVDAERAVADAVDAVGGVAHVVPGELVAVEIFPVAVGIVFVERVGEWLQLVQRPGAVGGEHADAGERRGAEEFPPSDCLHCRRPA